MPAPRFPVWRRPAAASGTFSGSAVATVKAGTAIRTAEAEKGSISAIFTVEAETENITIAAGWQVSDDNSTYYNVTDLDNTADTVLATGTAGDDAVVTKVGGPPDWVYGWKYVRPVCISGGTTGVTADTYSMTNIYVAPNE